MGDKAGFWVVRPWMLQCVGVVDTRGEDCRFRGEQRAWSFTPPGVERNRISSVVFLSLGAGSSIALLISDLSGQYIGPT